MVNWGPSRGLIWWTLSDSSAWGSGWHVEHVTIHDGLLAAVTGLPVAFWARRQLRPKRLVDDGLCHRCGYDLRATPDRCPECGLAVDTGKT